MVELVVSNRGKVELIYLFKKPSEAGEMIEFLSDFWPEAQFLVQPLRH